MTANDSYDYRRGTATERITTARLRPGNQVLTTNATIGSRAAQDSRLVAYPATRKTGSRIRTVERVEPFVPEPRDEDLGWNKRRRSGGRRTVVFTDGSVARNLAAHETWAIVSASLQEASSADTRITVEVVEHTRRLAVFTVTELAKITGETEQDILANVQARTLPEWATDYLPDVHGELMKAIQGRGSCDERAKYSAWTVGV